MSKGVKRNEVLDILELGLVFCVDTSNLEMKKQLFFILYRISLSRLIRFYRRITVIQNDFFYIEPLYIAHKDNSMIPVIPECDIYFLKSEIFECQEVIKSNIQEIMNIQSKDSTKTHTKKSYLKFLSYLLKKSKFDPASRYITGKIKKGMDEFPEIALDEKTIRGILQEIQQVNKAETGKS